MTRNKIEAVTRTEISISFLPPIVNDAFTYQYMSVYAYPRAQEKETAHISLSFSSGLQEQEDGSKHVNKVEVQLQNSDAQRLFAELIDELPDSLLAASLRTKGWECSTPDEISERDKLSCETDTD